MNLISFLLGACVIALATAKQCTNITVPVEIMARQGVFNVPEITTPVDATTFIQTFTSISNGTNYTMEALLEYQDVTGLYNISAKFCRPDNGYGTKPVVQVLSHGIGFDKTYWDLPYNNFNYSYIDVAVDEYGYCTLSYDRFGIGNSSHADPYEVVQAPAEISALYQLNSMLRMGTLPTVDQAFNESGTVVNVGHSFGSQQSYQLAAMYPNITDALILTGFSFNGTGLPRTAVGFNAKIARLNQPSRFGSTDAATAIDVLSMVCNGSIMVIKNPISALSSLNLTVSDYQNILQTTEICGLIAGYSMVPAPIPQDLPTGYLTWGDAQNNQFNFLYEPGFDTGILYYSEQNKQPFTVGELLTLGGAPATSPFAGPVQVVTGRQDGPYCAGDCLATGDPAKRNIPAGIGMYLPEASSFTTLIPEDTGHGLNLHYSAVAAYQQIQEFLKANDIAPS